jgi:KaiC/GvpD/RAD55 family RecA-like ATPase
LPTNPPSTASAGAYTPGGAAIPSAAKSTSGRKVMVPMPEDLELAKEDALLQLRIARSAHLYAVLISAALALDGIIVLLFTPTLPTLPPSAHGLAALNDTAFLLIPIAAGVAIAAVGLYTKWEAFQLWPWELHFSTTVAAMGVNILIAVVFALRIVGQPPFADLALLPAFYPIALAGISLALIGLVMTWTSWSLRQWASAIAAGLAIPTAAFVFFATPSSAPGAAGLSISLFLAALFYQTSGSFLHLISSGTRPHERELITSGQSRMFRMADEVRGKEEALQFRTAALVKREADVENAEASLARQRDSVQEARQQLDDLEVDYRKRADELADQERSWAGRIAEMDGRSRLLDDKSQALELREQEVARQAPQLSSREQRLVDREADQARRDAELAQRKGDLDRRTAALPEAEARLEARRKELDQKTAEVLRREGDVVSLETSARSGGAVSTSVSADLAAREVKLQQFKAVLEEQNVLLGRRARDAAEKSKAAEDALRRSAEKEAQLAAREATLQQRASEVELQAKSADERRARYDAAARDYETRLSDVGRQQVEAAQKGAEVDRTTRSLADRETALVEREKRLAASREELVSQAEVLTARERALEASEAEVGLKRAEQGRGGDLTIAGLAAVAAADRRDATVGSGAGRGSSVSMLEPASSAETLHGTPGRHLANRLPTGTPRLDDLLLGGLPPRGHVVLLGDAFVGKEIVLYSFIAEGLKRGEAAVLVTASRSPQEVAASLGVVLPQFREYEQLGMVTWIDASGGPATTPDEHRLITKGPDDRAGILSKLVAVSKQLSEERHLAYRVGFLGLSSVLAHVDERAGLSFLQNVVGILKPREALALYSLEGGAISEAQVESMLARMDGALVFRQDRDKTFLSVKGLGEVQTHDWVEVRATNRALIVGSFALERIR